MGMALRALLTTCISYPMWAHGIISFLIVHGFGFILLFFQSYISSPDKQFVASTIQAIGRCASNISEVTDTCLAGLVRLLSNRDGE